MPLVGTNFYGTQVQRTPWDDADAQNAAAQDQWRMAQFADARMRQGQSDARAMNQDNLNFGVWQSGRGDARSAQALAAQERLAKMGFDFQGGMFDKQEGAAAAREGRQNTREDELWRTRTEPFQKAQLAGIDRQNELARLRFEQEKAIAERAAKAQALPATGPRIVATTPQEVALVESLTQQGESPAAIQTALKGQQAQAAGRRIEPRMADLDATLRDLVAADAGEERKWYNPARWVGDDRDPDMVGATSSAASEAGGAFTKLKEAYVAAAGDEDAQDAIRSRVKNVLRSLGVDVKDPDFRTTYDKLAPLLETMGVLRPATLSSGGSGPDIPLAPGFTQ